MIYTFGANDIVTSGMPLEYNFMEVGFNTGNMAIARGLSDLINRKFGVKPFRYNSLCHINHDDVLVVGAANWISKSINLDWFFAQGIDRFNRVIVIGLGVQDLVLSKEDLSPSAKKFLDWLLNIDATICTRDLHTKYFLQNYFSKIYWTGCPSLRISAVNNLANSRYGYSYGGSIEVLKHAKKVDLLTNFEREIILNKLNENIFNSYILQAELPLMQSLLNNNNLEFLSYLKQRLSINPLNTHLPVEKFIYFFDLEQWIRSLSKNKIFIGTRLHGNILAWHAGCGVFLIAHDERTKAFIDDFCFPGALLSETNCLDDIIDAARHADYGEFYNKLDETQFNIDEAFKLYE